MRCLKTGFTILLFILGTATAYGDEVKTATITGRLAAKSGAPLADAYVYLFNQAMGPAPDATKYWRVPDEIVQADQSGSFTAQIPHGTYYLGAIKRVTGKDVGPPVAGDYFLDISTENGHPRMYLFNRERIDVGLIDEGQPFNPATIADMKGVTAIEGKVVNADGKPAAGVSVFAFLSASMVGRPLFSSDKTGSDGKFLLRVAKGGTYFLKAREDYGGGPPKLGGLIGYYGEHAALPIGVASGKIVQGIKVVVSPFPGQGGKPVQGRQSPAMPPGMRLNPVP